MLFIVLNSTSIRLVLSYHAIGEKTIFLLWAVKLDKSLGCSSAKYFHGTPTTGLLWNSLTKVEDFWPVGCFRILEKFTRGVSFSEKVQEKRFLCRSLGFENFLLTEKCHLGVKNCKRRRCGSVLKQGVLGEQILLFVDQSLKFESNFKHLINDLYCLLNLLRKRIKASVCNFKQ